MEDITVGKLNLQDMSKQQLRDMLDEKEIAYGAQAKEAGLIKLIMGSSAFNTGPDKTKKHPVFGEYINCIVHPQAKYNQEGSIYVGINSYSVNINPRVPVKLPKGVIKFLKEATDAKHIFNKSAVSENGNVGAHETVQVPKYVVEILLDD